ncbi:MAG: RNA polymerase-associated protein RapA [Proteobacteria bacterium]|jgi:ATP-dependent helicase HepA|nr:RNA polymerase-associated protein RapA [Pseudomonadota bacterium]
MNEYIPGQRMISDTEPELGLGTVLGIEHRRINIEFPASDETRTYALPNPPLHRVRFSAGDRIRDRQGQTIHIDQVQDKDGLLVYIGKLDDGTDAILPEAQLSDLTQLNKPRDRLLSGQLDTEHWYRLRLEAREKLQHLLPSPVYGLCGARVSLLPHQLYIANEISQRAAPRVLLADEVGLGKTIEAGLILHRQILTEQVKRVLIIVPPALLHQWLVEMLRRFNLRFSLLDESRCVALGEAGDNPFLSEQFVLCDLDFFLHHPQRQAQALTAGWDMLIVDEAHHLHWAPDKPGPEYVFIEQLAHQTAAILLLTATPEQLGAASHFARLRLLDPHRFHDLDAFLDEESRYQPVARAAAELLDASQLSAEAVATLHAAFGDDPESLAQVDLLQATQAPPDQLDDSREALLHKLVDRHGTGRVLFRNTRSAVKGFPLREAHAYPLPAPADYRCIEQALPTTEARHQFASNFDASFAQLSLTPETIYQTLLNLDAPDLLHAPDWWQCDPRVKWLARQLRQLKKQKVLIICAQTRTALDLEAVLRQREGLRVSAFHEDLSILERDRAAAWFADPEGGAQALICSEIGSEGRNFQFAHHLVLFDLPLHPDLLEQRIGRLDRIGQHETIHIHIPYIKGGAQEIIYRWYEEGLHAFTQTCPAGPGIFEQLGDRLQDLLGNLNPSRSSVDELITDSQPLYRDINMSLQQGRDRLLELNSYRRTEALTIRDQIQREDGDPLLPDHMARLCDAYGVEVEEHSMGSLILRPGDHMQVHHFPELKTEGVTVTFQRETALLHEDRLFLTWEHPMVTGALDLLLGNERGNAVLGICKLPGYPTGEILLETLHLTDCVSPAQLQIRRFLPPMIIHALLDRNGDDVSRRFSPAQLQGLPVELGKSTITQLITAQQDRLRTLLELADHRAQDALPTLIEGAITRMKTERKQELQRLVNLQRVNPLVREEEIDFVRLQIEQLERYLEKTRVQLDAVRLIITA